MISYRVLLSVIVLFVCLVALGVVASGQAQKAPAPVGTYQASTDYRENGNWVLVTVIDTRSGEIVRQERYGGFSTYSEVK